MPELAGAQPSGELGDRRLEASDVVEEQEPFHPRTPDEQVAFDAPIQGTCTTRGAINGFCSPIPNVATQLYGSFLGEPRTFGITFRGKI